MERTEVLEKFGITPTIIAGRDRQHPPYMLLINYAYKRVGGGRGLKYAEWNTDVINNLPEQKFNDLINKIQKDLMVTRELFKKFSQPMTIYEFLRQFSL